MYPPPRSRAVGAEPRVAERYERYQSSTVTVPAGTAFSTAVAFSGRPDRLHIQASAAGVEVRLRNRGEAEESAIRLVVTTPLDLALGRDTVEVRDPAGAGGQTLVVTAVWAERPESY